MRGGNITYIHTQVPNLGLVGPWLYLEHLRVSPLFSKAQIVMTRCWHLSCPKSQIISLLISWHQYISISTTLQSDVFLKLPKANVYWWPFDPLRPWFNWLNLYAFASVLKHSSGSLMSHAWTHHFALCIFLFSLSHGSHCHIHRHALHLKSCLTRYMTPPEDSRESNSCHVPLGVVLVTLFLECLLGFLFLN